jgi:two-component system, OmpR family, sensor histidine kinase MprB
VRPLTEVDSELHRIGLALLLTALGGVGLAALLGLLVARAALVPVRQLTATAERVSETGELRERIATRGRDELSRLGSAFNAMLAKLDQSARAQRQLVADASHELRTPLTSLRTNVEVLLRRGSLPELEREVLTDVVEQVSEMTLLINELTELARGESEPQEAEEVRLDLLVSEVAERIRRDFPSVQLQVEAEETLLQGVPASLARAIRNLLDNAAKWSPPGGVIEVSLGDGELTVRDHGPGISDDDLSHVFERFYRAASARGQPGSGLGLAIVQQVAVRHGGTITAENADGGGALMTMRLPNFSTVESIP